MGEQYYQLILEKYRNRERDFDGLFETILEIGDEVGLERALGYLERCVWIKGTVPIFHVERAKYLKTYCMEGEQ